MSRYIDLAFEQDDEGIIDLVIDETTGDFVTTDGMETAVVCSLFSDRRAYSEEVPDPMLRRGWIGDLTSGIPGDLHGSGLWLYEQSRLTDEVATGVANEGRQCLEWMEQEKLVTSVASEVSYVPSARKLSLTITTRSPDGGVSVYAYDLALATRNGILVRLGAV